jgi:Domain of unknown function (DUF4112)
MELADRRAIPATATGDRDWFHKGNLLTPARICLAGAFMQQAIKPYIVPRYREDALTPEVIDPRIADVEALARWLDYAFALPGGFRFGIAGIIGFIPGIGDVIDALISLYIVVRALQLGIARVAVARMVVNVAIEALAGSVPFVGTVFDMAFKANRRNYELLKKHIAQPERQRARDWLFLVLTLVILAAGIALPLIGLIELAKHL